MGEAMTVGVTGATGFVGREIVRVLADRGHRVRALVRDRAKARQVLPDSDRVEMVVGDLPGPAAGELAKGCGAVIHLVGIIRERAGGQTFQRLHVEATRSILDACAGAGVGRLAHMSALGVSDEGRSAYQRTKWEAEQLVRRSGLAWTIFRPGLIHGRYGEFMGMAKGWVTGTAPPKCFLPYFTRVWTDPSVPFGPRTHEDPVVAPIAVEDVAECFVRALTRDETIGETYHLAGPEALGMPELLMAIRDAVPGAKRSLRPMGLPSDLAWAGATAAQLVGLGSMVPFDPGMALMGAEDSVSPMDKARAHLGVEPRPFRARLREYAAHL